jgi:hypothetical protein
VRGYFGQTRLEGNSKRLELLNSSKLDKQKRMQSSAEGVPDPLPHEEENHSVNENSQDCKAIRNSILGLAPCHPELGDQDIISHSCISCAGAL